MKKIYDDLQCPILYIHTFCDQTSYPLSFLRSIQAENPQVMSERAVEKLAFIKWKKEREDEVTKVLGKIINSTCSAFSLSTKSMYFLLCSSID